MEPDPDPVSDFGYTCSTLSRLIQPYANEIQYIGALHLDPPQVTKPLQVVMTCRRRGLRREITTKCGELRTSSCVQLMLNLLLRASPAPVILCIRLYAIQPTPKARNTSICNAKSMPARSRGILISVSQPSSPLLFLFRFSLLLELLQFRF